MYDDFNLGEEIRIQTKDNNIKMDLGNMFHNFLRGFPDYINDRIILNVDEENEIRIWIFDDCRNQELVKQLKELAETQR